MLFRLLDAFLVLRLVVLFYAAHANACSRDLQRFASDRAAYDLVIGIATGEDNKGYKSSSSRKVTYYDRRMAIRGSWKALAKQADIPVFFILSDYRLPEAESQESQTFQDILLVPDPAGEAWGYHGAPKKSQFLMQFIARQCASVKYVVKTDDDTYVHMPRLSLFVNLTHGNNLYVGNRLCHQHSTKMPPQWRSPKYTPFSGLTHFPCYMQGGGWLLSGNLAKAIGTVAELAPLQRQPADDMSLGMWLFGYDHTQVNIRPADLIIDFIGNFNSVAVLKVICNDRWLFLHSVFVGDFRTNYDTYCGPMGRNWSVAEWETDGLPPHIPPSIVQQ
eukprot:EG_transcript_12491